MTLRDLGWLLVGLVIGSGWRLWKRRPWYERSGSVSDITKCGGQGCPIRDRCERYTVPSGPWQSWFITPPGRPDPNDPTGRVWKCTHHLTIRNPRL